MIKRFRFAWFLVGCALRALLGYETALYVVYLEHGKLKVSWGGLNCPFKSLAHRRDPNTGAMVLEVHTDRPDGVPFVPLSVRLRSNS